MRMRHPCLRLSVPALALALAAGGCIMPFNGPAGARRDVQRITGREYDCTFAVTVGRSGLALVRWATKDSGDEEFPLKGLRKVEVGVYEVRDTAGGVPEGAELTAAPWIGWTPIVEMHPEDRENVLVLAETRSDGSTRRLLFVVESDDELVIVRLKGRLDRFIEEAIRFAFQEADRPDLIAPSLEEYRRGSGTGGEAPRTLASSERRPGRRGMH